MLPRSLRLQLLKQMKEAATTKSLSLSHAAVVGWLLAEARSELPLGAPLTCAPITYWNLVSRSIALYQLGDSS